MDFPYSPRLAQGAHVPNHGVLALAFAAQQPNSHLHFYEKNSNLFGYPEEDNSCAW